MRFANWPVAAIGAALAIMCTNAESTRTLRGSVEGGQEGESVWIGVFGDEMAEGIWTQAIGASFEVALPLGEPATLLVVTKNRVPRTVPVTDGSPATVALRLAPGLTLAGTVRSEDGARLEDVQVFVQPVESTGPIVPPRVAPIWHSDQHGEFRVGGLHPGHYMVTLTAEGQVPLTLKGVQVREGAANQIDAELLTGHFILGRVVDNAGDPVAGVDVVADTRIWNRSPTTTKTGNDGSYRLGPLPLGERVSVFAQSPGLGSTLHHDDILAPREGLVLVFRRHVVLGRMLDATTGVPVRKFRLTVLCQGDDWVHEVEADDGRFRLPLDGGAHSFIAQAPGYPPWFTSLVPPETEEYDLGEIALVPGRSLSGRVVDADTGKPIRGAWINRILPSRAHGVWAMWSANYTGAPKPAVTGDDGIFTLHDLPMDVRVGAYAEGYAARDVRLPPGASHLDFELDAVVPRPVVVIAGSIVRVDGTPVAGSVNLFRAADVAFASVGYSSDSIDQIYAHESGEFRFEEIGLPDGLYVLVAGSNAGVVAQRTVEIKANQSVEDVQLIVKEGGWLRISLAGLLAAEGGARVTIRDKEARTVFNSVLGNGTHRVSGVPEKAVVVATASVGGQSRWFMRKIRLGDEAEVATHFDFTARSRLTGTVTAGGRPLTSLELRVVPANPSAPTALSRTNHQGNYDLYGLTDGRHMMRTRAGHSFEVHVAQDTQFDIELSTVSLAGVVRYARTGQPIWAADVRLKARDGYFDLAATQPDGTFRFDGLAAGEHVLSVSEPGFESLSRNLWIAGDEVVELDLVEHAGVGEQEQHEEQD